MQFVDENSFISALVNITIDYKYRSSVNDSMNPAEAVFIVFKISQIILILSLIIGVPGNIALIFTIIRSSFCHYPYGLLLLFLAIFDILRLLCIIFYFFIRTGVIPLTVTSSTIYVASYRYPRFVTNWLKVFLAIERLIAVKYWIEHRYNLHSMNNNRSNHKRQRKLLLLIFMLLVCALISQHPNFIPKRFSSTYFDPRRLLIINVPNPSFYYGNRVFNGVLYTIISYIIIDDFLPIITLIVCNTVLLYELKHLPQLTRGKLSESALILLFLTLFSIFILPKSFLVIFNLYANRAYINETTIAIISHTFQGLEIINHALTGYTCFLSCQTLRKDLFENLRNLVNKFRRTNPRFNPTVIELTPIPHRY